MSPYSHAEKVIVALDYADSAQAIACAKNLSAFGVRFKVGMELFYAAGPSIVTEIKKQGEVFLDLKLHDIPKTMAKTASVLASYGVWMTTVHAAAGHEAVSQAVMAANEAASKVGLSAPLIMAVTLLTSLPNLSHVGSSWSAPESVSNLAILARQAGCQGVVCSVHEAASLKASDPLCLTVTPGIRMLGDAAGDQIRTATPAAAMAAKSDYLVVGRPITAASDPAAALAQILADLI